MELVENVYVSEFTKKTLEQFGWKEGHAIPADLGQIMIDMKSGLPLSPRADVLIDKDVMSAEQVEQVTEMLKKARELGDAKKRNADIAEKTKNMAPDVAEAYRRIASGQPAEDGPQIIDDRDDEPAALENPAPPPPSPAEEPAAETKEKEKETDTSPTLVVFCPRCGWDIRQKFEAVPTQRDKEDFLATLLGSTRFKKQYELFGGRIKVMFRSLMAEENKLIYRQLVLDQKENRVTTEAEWFAQFMDYRLACSLEALIDRQGKIVATVPTLAEMPFKDDPEHPLATPLPRQLALLEETLAQEATRRIVSAHLRQFQRLVEGLEAMALEPSFWDGIE